MSEEKDLVPTTALEVSEVEELAPLMPPPGGWGATYIVAASSIFPTTLTRTLFNLNDEEVVVSQDPLDALRDEWTLPGQDLVLPEQRIFEGRVFEDDETAFAVNDVEDGSPISVPPEPAKWHSPQPVDNRPTRSVLTSNATGSYTFTSPVTTSTNIKKYPYVQPKVFSTNVKSRSRKSYRR
jgi:hypothetical protein